MENLTVFKKNLLIISVLILLAIPSIAFAVPGLPIVQCGTSTTAPCTRCDLFKLLKNIIDFTIGVIMPAVGVLLFVWAGFLILLGGANPNLVSQGKTIFTNTFYGILIMLAAWMITNTLIKSVGAQYDNADTWWQFTCVETAPTTSPKYLCNQNNQCVENPNGNYATSNCDNQCGAPPPVGGNCSGVSCSDSNLNICGQDTGANCSESAVNQWDSQIRAAAANNQIGSGIDTIALIKAIISQESGGRTNLTASASLSYGIMQLRPTTADSFKSGCTSANITPDWLKDSNNVQASVCIAINYLKSLVGFCGASVRNLAAGYNGGGAAKGACDLSQSCASCSICGSEKTRRWECLWDGPDGEHKVCNVDRAGSSFNATRKYVPKVSYCYTKFGGTDTGGLGTGTGDLSLASISPATYTAGIEKSFNQETGVVEYTYIETPFEIKGQNLAGTNLSSDNTGVDGKPGIEFKNIQATADSIKGTMLIHSTAKDGNTKITVKNSTNSADIIVNVTITGTQYLKRKFANNPKISFRGNWKEVMPNQTIFAIEDSIKKGLVATSSNSYRQLDFTMLMYEEKFYNEKNPCGKPPEGVVYLGCADVFGPSVKINLQTDDSSKIAGTIFHELGHKLHFSNVGTYHGKSVPGAKPSNFQKEWDALNIISPGNTSACQYMPLKDSVTWKDGTSDSPYCVFFRAYGAYLESEDELFWEDPSTMLEFYFNPKSLPDPKHMAKLNLLKKYGFLP